jgi:hypothetical protein
MNQGTRVNNDQNWDDELPSSASLAPVRFHIKGKAVLNLANPESGSEILAEFDYLHHYSKKICALLDGKNVCKLTLTEDRSILAFHLLDEEEIRGYQSARPYPLPDSLELF